VGARGTGTTLPAVPSPTEFAASSALRDVHFEFDKYDIRPSEKSALDANVRWLKAHARALVLIEGVARSHQNSCDFTRTACASLLHGRG
jgi:outer membrane protein OmpA-like peptidoglycan-associated protein